MHVTSTSSKNYDLTLFLALPFILPILPIVGLMHLIAALESRGETTNETEALFSGNAPLVEAQGLATRHWSATESLPLASTAS